MVDDDQLELTAYHEAGHVVMGVMLGAEIRSASIVADFDSEEAPRYGACELAWSMRGVADRQHAEREIRTALAGPVAEQIYVGETEIRIQRESSVDWIYAASFADKIHADKSKRTSFLFDIAEGIRDLYRRDEVWAAVASTADELLAHDELDGETLTESVQFWIRRLNW